VARYQGTPLQCLGVTKPTDGLAFRKILRTDAPVLPIQIERRWRDIAGPRRLATLCLGYGPARAKKRFLTISVPAKKGFGLGCHLSGIFEWLSDRGFDKVRFELREIS
jgi:hypothetical protein